MVPGGQGSHYRGDAGAWGEGVRGCPTSRDFGELGVVVAGSHLVGFEGGAAGDANVEVRIVGGDFFDGVAHFLKRFGDVGEGGVAAFFKDVDDDLLVIRETI